MELSAMTDTQLAVELRKQARIWVDMQCPGSDEKVRVDITINDDRFLTMMAAADRLDGLS